MQAIKQISLESPDQKRPSVSLVQTSRKPLPRASVIALGTMMAQAQAYFPNQTLPEGTPAVYLTAWEQMTEKYGLETFRDGLWKALSEAEFFPVPKLINLQCGEIYRKQRMLERIETERREREEAERRRRDHPEEFIHVRHVWAEANEKLNQGGKR